MPFLSHDRNHIEPRLKGLEDEGRAIFGIVIIGFVGTIYAILKIGDRVGVQNGRVGKLEAMTLSSGGSPAGQSTNLRLDKIEAEAASERELERTHWDQSKGHLDWASELKVGPRLQALENDNRLEKALLRSAYGLILLFVPILAAVLIKAFL